MTSCTAIPTFSDAESDFFYRAVSYLFIFFEREIATDESHFICEGYTHEWAHKHTQYTNIHTHMKINKKRQANNEHMLKH